MPETPQPPPPLVLDYARGIPHERSLINPLRQTVAIIFATVVLMIVVVLISCAVAMLL